MNEKKLYHFLMTHETKVMRNDGEVEAWVHVPHYEVKEFAQIVGENELCEGEVEAVFMPDTLAVELNHWILCDGKIEEYEDCFDADEWKDAFEEGEARWKTNGVL